MRTSVDIPDALLVQIRRRLKAEGRTLRDAILEGLQRTLLAEDPAGDFRLRDAAFDGEVGFAESFDAAQLDRAIRDDAEDRFAAEDHRDYRP